MVSDDVMDCGFYVCVQKEVHDAKVPLAYRDLCVDLLIPLNACRRKNYYLPWRCEDERHAYELCQYKEYKLRKQQKQQQQQQ